MINSCERQSPLSKGRMIVLFVNYFIGYNLLYPLLLRRVTLWLDPTARMIPDWLQLLTYLFMIVISVFVGWPLLRESHQGVRKHKFKIVTICLRLLGIFYVCSLFLNMIVMMFTTTTTSANQSQVVSALQVSPFLTLFSTIIYAPIVEELLFRGVFFRCIRPHMKLWLAAICSALIFGFIHVMDSFFTGNFADMIYLFSYGLIGFFLALAYEKTESIYGSMMLHFMNNAVAFIMIAV